MRIVRLISLATAIGTLAVAAGCGAPSVAPEFPASQRIAWSSCYEPVKHLECARVAVPLDWQHPSDGKIELAVIRHRASRPRERIGSLFFNWGGPGVAGIPQVKDMAAELDAMGRGRFDVVSWDPRGTGESSRIVCFDNAQSRKEFWRRDWSIPTTRAESIKYVPKAVEFVKRCTSLSGELLAHISTADTVRDLDYLRQLVGDPQLNYRGISYGTFIGQTYANMFPQRIRAMVIDGVVDPIAFTDGTAESIATSIADADPVFDKFQSLCQSAGRTRCDLAGRGPVAARVRRLLARLKRAPIGTLTYGDALIVLWARLGAPKQWPELATDLNKAASGDGSALERTARDVKAFTQPHSIQPSGFNVRTSAFHPAPDGRSGKRSYGG